MKLDPKARDIAKRAWSVRLMAVAIVLTFVEVVFPFFGQSLAQPFFTILQGLIVVAAFFARFIAQERLDD